MKLTPLDIRGKEFKHTMRGYLGADVDDFLEQIAEEFERLFGANIALAEHCEEMEERLEQYQQLEQTLRNTLTVAQRGAEELIGDRSTGSRADHKRSRTHGASEGQ